VGAGAANLGSAGGGRVLAHDGATLRAAGLLQRPEAAERAGVVLRADEDAIRLALR
jgi:hypothetical protein